MIKLLQAGAAALLLTLGVGALAQTGEGYASDGTASCIGCHDFGPESPAHQVMAGSHSPTGEGSGIHGCEDCHGPSGNHAKAPTATAPGVSFGPRWTTSPASQDQQCLACHEANTAIHWRFSMHMLENLTCTTCHDIHTGGDKVLFPARQDEVCTTCHKVRKKGIHGDAGLLDTNPPCSTCHNPHNHESAKSQMLADGSRGCRSCHDLVAMAKSDQVTDKAKNYHQVMGNRNRTCVECHQGIAHAPAGSAPPRIPEPVTRGTVTLFYPGLADSEWLTQQHPGAQPLRQGTDCRQCHRGEEADLGRSRAGDFRPSHRDVTVAFAENSDDQSVDITLEWLGEADDKSISMMWGTAQSNSAFARGGCFAACHSDLPGMARNRGQEVGKYLWSARQQQQSLGRPAINRDEKELAAMMQRGEFVVLWRVDLQTSEVQAALVLDDVHWQFSFPIEASSKFSKGRWTVAITRDLGKEPEHMLKFDREDRLTFGIALHGARNPGPKHWVSLPQTVSYGDRETEFKVK